MRGPRASADARSTGGWRLWARVALLRGCLPGCRTALPCSHSCCSATYLLTCLGACWLYLAEIPLFTRTRVSHLHPGCAART